MNCPNCNKEVNPEWKLCPFCGFQPKLCSKPRCTTIWLPHEAHFCPKCGSPVVGEEDMNLKLAIKEIIKSKLKDGSITSNSSGDKSSRRAFFCNRLTFSVGGVEFVMIKVKAGTFNMGDDNENDNPIHKVELSRDYYIGETHVTQALWEAVGCKNDSEFKEDDNPVEKVSWNDCQKFIRKLNQKLRQQIEPLGLSFRLPTEAEWEFAAHGGNGSDGYIYAGSDDPDDVAWFDDNSHDKTHNVAEKEANELGLYDMNGNVWEWCQDWYNQDYYKKSPIKDPNGPPTGDTRVIRGGAWNDTVSCTISFRCYLDPSRRDNDVGFRLAL